MNESTGDSRPLNPYAPTVHVDEGGGHTGLRESGGVSQVRVIFSVIGAVAASGGLFVITVGLIAAGVMLFSEPGSPSVAWLWVVGWLAGYAIIGMLAVGVVAAILVPLSAAAFGGLELFGNRLWDRRSIRNFGILCGFFTGWLFAVALSGFGLMGTAIGFIPGGFGAIFTPLLLRRLLRRAESALEHT